MEFFRNVDRTGDEIYPNTADELNNLTVRIVLPGLIITRHLILPRFIQPALPPQTQIMSHSTKLDRYKLETIFTERSVTNTTYRSDLATGERRTAVNTTWTNRETIGSGGFSVVVLQQAEEGQSRAVKKLLKGLGKIDYARELSVLTQVADVCFSDDRNCIEFSLISHSFSSIRISSYYFSAGMRMMTLSSSPWNISLMATLASISSPVLAHLEIHGR